MAEAIEVLERMGHQVDLHKTTVVGLRQICKQLGITGYSGMKKDEIIAAIQVKQNRPQAPAVEVAEPANACAVPAAPAFEIRVAQIAEPEPEKKKSWEDNFIAELRNVCINLDELPETHFLPEELMRVISLINNAEKVEELADLGEVVLNEHIHLIRQELPKYQREVYAVVNQIAKAAPVTVDVDFV